MGLRAFDCGVRGTDWHRTVHAATPGKAKAIYWRDVCEAWPDTPFTAVTVHCIGDPRTDDGFLKTAAYRNVPFARIGMRVEVAGHSGFIAGKNSSANFDVYFTDGPDKGQTLNCHPNWKMRYFGEDGKVIGEK